MDLYASPRVTVAMALGPGSLVVAVSPESGLHVIPEYFVDDGSVFAIVQFALVMHLADINRVLEDSVQSAAR